MCLMACMKMMDKALERAKTLGMNQSQIARAIGVDPARITDWKDESKPNKPSIWQALALARLLRVTLESLVDDEMDLVTIETGAVLQPLKEDERYLLRTYRNLNITADEAFNRLRVPLVGLPAKDGEILVRVPRREKATGG